ncbi:MAG: hypothetical protein GF349_02160 [Candidatus Magasanikbacteria bacterium]|nr:hypothetical protein [Candidatus Magasanikbacteria bacterium]
MKYNLSDDKSLKKLRKKQPKRFSKKINGGGQYLNLMNIKLDLVNGLDKEMFEKASRIMRALIFASVESARSGHPGGSSGKVEQFLSMTLTGGMAFDLLDPKNSGRDRFVWSAGHCSPLLYAGLSLYYEALKKTGHNFNAKKINAVLAKDLVNFRRPNGPQGHIEGHYPLSDFSTGPSGHGFPAAGGMAIVHKSVGLDTKVWVMMGDAESEEGMTYEARNILSTMGMDNMIVSYSYNHYGIDGDIDEVISTPIINHWLGLGWNVIEVDGYHINNLVQAYKRAKKGFDNQLPTLVLVHTIKGKLYGDLEDTAESHGTPTSHDKYIEIMNNLGFDIPGEEGGVGDDIKVVMKDLDIGLARYLEKRLTEAKRRIKTETKLVSQMRSSLKRRKLENPINITRPKKLPNDLQFKSGEKIATRKATEAFFRWLMGETAFFWAGAGDLSKSVLTSKAEKVYGIINKKNPLGRGIRYGISEANMAMMGSAMTHDRLPGGFQPVSVFGSYGVFTNIMCNAIRLTVISNHLCPKNAGFFIALAAHDGPETGEDGPTHQGLYWMSLYNALPGIKVYKPLDANETIEMLFYALKKAEPIVLSVSRPNTLVFERSNFNNAKEAVNGAYIFKNFKRNSKKKVTLVVSGGQLLSNLLETLPELETKLNIKIVAVTSPELFEDLKIKNPTKAAKIFSKEDRSRAVLMHNGWKGFLYPFLLPENYSNKIIAIDTYLKSGSVEEVYDIAGLSSDKLKEKIKAAIK